MDSIVSFAKQEQLKMIMLESAETAIGFYMKYGFVGFGVLTGLHNQRDYLELEKASFSTDPYFFYDLQKPNNEVLFDILYSVIEHEEVLFESMLPFVLNKEYMFTKESLFFKSLAECIAIHQEIKMLHILLTEVYNTYLLLEPLPEKSAVVSHPRINWIDVFDVCTEREQNL